MNSQKSMTRLREDTQTPNTWIFNATHYATHCSTPKLAGPTRREWGKFHPQYTNVKVDSLIPYSHTLAQVTWRGLKV